ncbi:MULTISPECIES: DUF4391 domain-containing protein [Pseudomonas]|uniref:DUF4391 family protein n=1 Tax=Pseudomonas lactis TaxID=1615674 RepID=A0ABS9FLN1_9PSED|nr:MULTISPECIES: DUF4391 domain-containing protein [Pseudomonas]MCF4971277.1 DUF4391 family protein [Pseudomonas lactis]MCF5000901.1 DUF4391 family protein [Pseudomonas lactis]MCF5007364.1 DUF4391 family protein [Pseudomonas lactis]MCF5010673.1 DUF4391 family protein [Pseudomonas lactis]MCF5017083.1 DUF4391 family protein [Pseudomonas lactis]
MTSKDIIAALQLPEHARINQRISKKLLIENLMPTAADRQQINDGIEEIYWIAALKPANCGIPDFRDAQREYVEVAVLHMILRPDARAGRLVELLHRAVPHPALLLISQQDSIQLSLSHKRWAQNEAGKIVLDGTIFTESLSQTSQLTMAFLNVMGIDHQPRSNLEAFYQGWIDTLQTLQAAQHTGSFRVAKCQLDATTRHVALQVCSELEAKILALRAKAQKTQQIARQVELNMQLKQLQQALGEAQAKL